MNKDHGIVFDTEKNPLDTFIDAAAWLLQCEERREDARIKTSDTALQDKYENEARAAMREFRAAGVAYRKWDLEQEDVAPSPAPSGVEVAREDVLIAARTWRRDCWNKPLTKENVAADNEAQHALRGAVDRLDAQESAAAGKEQSDGK